MSSRNRREQAIHTTHRIAVWAVLPALMLALLTLVPMSPAQAVESCFLDSTGTLSCPQVEEAPAPVAPASLLPEITYQRMTPAQAAAMRRFEEEAVRGVLLVHHLPASDAAEVRTWARDEATGLLQKLVIKAVDTPAPARTTDQQQVAAWVGDLYVARARPGLLQAGAEYASWAGLNVTRFWELVNGGASKQELTAFLSRTPQPYSGSGPSDSTGGFCKYLPPAPYTAEYQGHTWQTCYTDCTALRFDGAVMSDMCQPPVTHEEFIRWGQARVVTQTEAVNAEVVNTAVNYAGAASIAGWLGSEGLLRAADGAGSILDLFKMMAPVDIPKFLSWGVWNPITAGGSYEQLSWKAMSGVWEGPDGKFAKSIALQHKSFFFGTSDKLVAYDLKRIVDWLRNPHNLRHLRIGAEASMTWHIRETIAQRLESRMNRIWSKLARSMGGLAAEVVITAMTTALEEGIELGTETELPGRIASNVVNGRSLVAIDPAALAAMPGGRDLVRNLFANAVVAERTFTSTCGDQCPEPPPVRVASYTDPHFLVRGLSSPVAVQTANLKLGKVVDDQWTATEARVDGGWFVERWYDSDHGLDLQHLELQYTNWDMQPETAWLIRYPGGKYLFSVVSPEKSANFDLETCQEDHSCWTTGTIAYLNADGNPMLASLEGYQPPTGTPSTSPAAPQVGQAVTFDAGGFAPGGARLEVTYKWRFQQGGCGTPCVTYIDEVPEPLYGTTVTGRNVMHTWQEPGTYRVELTATDGDGRRAVTTMDVTVGGGGTPVG